MNNQNYYYNATMWTLISLILVSGGKLSSQDIKGAYMQVQWSSGFTYSVTLFLFADSSVNVNRPSVSLNFGDATSGTCSLSSTTFINRVGIKKYSGVHTYPANGQYYLNYTDTFRMSGIKNIKNSSTQRITLTTKFTLDQFTAPNSNPSLQNFPIYFGVNGSNAFFDPNFIDPNGDSLSFPALIPCYITNVSDYYFPNGSTLNNKGIVSFSKDSIGLYCFSYQIFEWRKDIDGNYQNISWSVIDFAMDITTNVGIVEYNGISDTFEIYPNPVSDILEINFKKHLEEGTQIEIINAVGQIALRTCYSNKIDVSFLPSGLYTIKIANRNNLFHSKFLKE